MKSGASWTFESIPIKKRETDTRPKIFIFVRDRCSCGLDHLGLRWVDDSSDMGWCWTCPQCGSSLFMVRK